MPFQGNSAAPNHNAPSPTDGWLVGCTTQEVSIFSNFLFPLCLAALDGEFSTSIILLRVTDALLLLRRVAASGG